MSDFGYIDKIIQENDCVLFMKGTREIPQCGFSYQAVQMLEKSGVDFMTVNILADPQLRQDLKTYSDWPTFPQLYVKQEFIGGVDIMAEMDQAGELQAVLAALSA